jgi:hypothetical protein
MSQALRRVYGDRGGGGCSVADEKRSRDKEPLTEREQAALKNLARHVVGEAGAAKDPEREAELEARLEASKMAAETAKTSVLLSSGALVGMAALVGVLDENSHTYWLMVAILLVCASVLVGFWRMDDLAEAVAARRAPALRGYRLILMGPTLLATGLLTFSFYVLYNVPYDPAGRVPQLRLTRNQLVWGTLILGMFLTALIVGGNALYERIRRGRPTPADAAETVEEGGAEPRPDAPGAQEGAQRPWWRRMFGG